MKLLFPLLLPQQRTLTIPPNLITEHENTGSKLSVTDNTKGNEQDIGNELKGWRSTVSLVWKSALKFLPDTKKSGTGMVGTPEVPALRRLIKEYHNFQNINNLGTQVHAFKSSTGKAEAGESLWVWGQVYIANPKPARATYCGTLPQKQTNKIKYRKANWRNFLENE